MSVDKSKIKRILLPLSLCSVAVLATTPLIVSCSTSTTPTTQTAEKPKVIVESNHGEGKDFQWIGFDGINDPAKDYITYKNFVQNVFRSGRIQTDTDLYKFSLLKWKDPNGLPSKANIDTSLVDKLPPNFQYGDDGKSIMVANGLPILGVKLNIESNDASTYLPKVIRFTYEIDRVSDWSVGFQLKSVSPFYNGTTDIDHPTNNWNNSSVYGFMLRLTKYPEY